MKYWNENRKQYYTHVEPRADWRGPVEKWIDWMGVIGRSKQTLRTRYYQLSRFSRVVNKKINDVNEDDLILVLAPPRRGSKTRDARGSQDVLFMGD